MFKKNSGQIWVETVIYTLIGLAIIGVLLSLVKPAIEEKKDQVLLEQNLDVLNSIDSAVEDVRYYGVGNSRILEVKIRKGELIINSTGNSIKFVMESRYMYSEPEQVVEIGRVKALTKKKRKIYDVSLILNYSNSINLTWNGKETTKIFQASPTPYKIRVTNIGKIGDLVNIDFT